MCMLCRSLFVFLVFVVLFILAIVLSVLLWFTDSDYPPLCGHCVVCSSLIYWFWLPPFGIFKLFLYNFSIGFLNYFDSVEFVGVFFFHFIRSEYISLLCALGLYNYFTAILSLFYMQFLSWAIYTLFVRFFYWTLEQFRKCGIYLFFL